MKRFELIKADVPVDERGIPTEPRLMYATSSRSIAEQFWAAQRAKGVRVALFDAKLKETIHNPDANPL